MIEKQGTREKKSGQKKECQAKVKNKKRAWA